MVRMKTRDYRREPRQKTRRLQKNEKDHGRWGIDRRETTTTMKRKNGSIIEFNLIHRQRKACDEMHIAEGTHLNNKA